MDLREERVIAVKSGRKGNCSQDVLLYERRVKKSKQLQVLKEMTGACPIVLKTKANIQIKAFLDKSIYYQQLLA